MGTKIRKTGEIAKYSPYLCNVMKPKYTFLILIAALHIAGCSSHHPGSEKQLHETLDSFCEAYFSWHFPEALPYCTPSSRTWLSYAASNVHQADVDILRNMNSGTAHEIIDIDYLSDSLAEAHIAVTNVLLMDTIGTEGHLADKASFTIPLHFDKNGWKVDLNSLPRNEKLSE